MSNRWYGIDLDGTLAVYNGEYDALHIGEPIPLMVYRVKKMLAEGKRVKIFTARACTPGFHSETDEYFHPVKRAIQNWCLKHIGQVLAITNEKDYDMEAIYDDRAIQIESNTGMRMDGEKDYDCPCCDGFDPLTDEDTDSCTCEEWCPNA